ncbi:MAG TPA: DUF1579 family protein [Candidatus Eisenbacteria bacterium]
MTKGFAAALVLACAWLAPAAEAKPPKPGGPVAGMREPGPAPNPVAEEMSRYTAPGPHHRELEAFAGSWTTRMLVRDGPDARPLEFAGSAEYRMILGGRFLQLESRMLVNGVENHGLGLYGYDAFKEKYSCYYIHDGETQALVGLGDRDSTGTAITFEVAMDMPVTGERGKPIRAVLRRVSDHRHVFEMFEKYMDGREWKVLEITYDRAR